MISDCDIHTLTTISRSSLSLSHSRGMALSLQVGQESCRSQSDRSIDSPIHLDIESGRQDRTTAKAVRRWSLRSIGPQLTYLTTRLEVLASCIDALVVVDEILPAMLGLVLVRETCIKSWFCCQLPLSDCGPSLQCTLIRTYREMIRISVRCDRLTHQLSMVSTRLWYASRTYHTCDKLERLRDKLILVSAVRHVGIFDYDVRLLAW